MLDIKNASGVRRAYNGGWCSPRFDCRPADNEVRPTRAGVAAGRTDGRRSIIIRPLSVVVSLRWTVLNDIAESTGRKSVRRQANRYAVRPSSSALSTRNFLLLVRLRCSLLGPGRRLEVYRSLSGGLAITRPRRRRRQSNDLLFLPIGARDRIESKSLSD